MSGRLILAGVLLTLLASAEDVDDLKTYFASQCEAKGFSGVALVKRGAETIFEAACGLANAEWSIPNSVDTRFRIASISKQFTAAAVLLLHEDKKLALTDPVGRHVKDLPESWRSATIHQLLTHTSGIRSYTATPEVKRLNRLGATPRELLNLVAAEPLAYPHGARFAYNNTGYVLLGLVIESASGKKYEDFVQARLFDPLGMKNSGFDLAEILLPRRANGYRIAAGQLKNADPVDATVPWSAGGFYSTVQDLAIWAEALSNGRLLKKDSLSRMFRGYPETSAYGMHYGYGTVLAERHNHRLHYHGGGINGFSSILQRYPDANLTVTVLSNRDLEAAKAPSWTVADGLAEILLRPHPRQ